mmetsp:Transcript_44896/g.126795  ORF Transcript_44896/g.126795 Transcript_44896/m.126795 type:complete len:116 (+) Transcript_44896:401-748(+)
MPSAWGLRLPRIEHLACPRLRSKAAVRVFLKFVQMLRPAKFDLCASLPPDDESEDEDDEARSSEPRSFAWECYERVKEGYVLTEGRCGEVDGHGDSFWLNLPSGSYEIEMQLVAR